MKFRNHFVLTQTILCLVIILCSCNKELQQGKDWIKEQVTYTISTSGTTATFTGHIEVSEEELPCEFGIICFDEGSENYVNNRAIVFESKKSDFTLFYNLMSPGATYNYMLYKRMNHSAPIYGDTLKFTTQNLLLDNVVINSSDFMAEVGGTLNSFTEEEVRLIKLNVLKIGLVYSLNPEHTTIENGTSVDFSKDISADGTVSTVITGLMQQTTYYFRQYVYDKKHKKETYGPIMEFTTLDNVYDIELDIDMISASDLSSIETANCYIVSETGSYKFRTVKGNSTESIDKVVSANILWESFGTTATPLNNELIKGVSYEDGYIAFQVAEQFKKGNVLIAAKDKAGKILWSWHIWLTEYPEEQEYYKNAGTMMDRNIGATCAKINEISSFGLMYQWGRKDPFLGPASDYPLHSSIIPPVVSTITWPSPVTSNEDTGTIEYSISNPTTFIIKSSNEDWLSTQNNSLWTTSKEKKSIYDPCPAGWRVPDGGPDGVWATATPGRTTTCNSDHGTNHGGIFGDYSIIWYPGAGYIDESTGLHEHACHTGGYWSASTIDNQVYIMYFTDDFYLYPIEKRVRSRGLSVRCIKK